MKLLKYLWALPNTLLGLMLLPLLLVTRSLALHDIGLRRGCIEVAVCGWFRRIIDHFDIQAITLGCVIISRNWSTLFRVRNHEHVHVRQYERWGPFFLPAYFACAAYLKLRGKDPYWDNPFELEAFDHE